MVAGLSELKFIGHVLFRSAPMAFCQCGDTDTCHTTLLEHANLCAPADSINQHSVFVLAVKGLVESAPMHWISAVSEQAPHV